MDSFGVFLMIRNMDLLRCLVMIRQKTPNVHLLIFIFMNKNKLNLFCRACLVLTMTNVDL